MYTSTWAIDNNIQRRSYEVTASNTMTTDEFPIKLGTQPLTLFSETLVSPREGKITKTSPSIPIAEDPKINAIVVYGYRENIKSRSFAPVPTMNMFPLGHIAVGKLENNDSIEKTFELAKKNKMFERITARVTVKKTTELINESEEKVKFEIIISSKLK